MILWILKWILQVLWGDWQHVGVLIADGKRTGKGEYTYYFHCFESRFGHRRVVIKVVNGQKEDIYREPMLKPMNSIIDDDRRDKVYGTAIYQEEIYPWLHGRAHSKLPNYQQIKTGRWDFTRLLKGDPTIVINNETTPDQK